MLTRASRTKDEPCRKEEIPWVLAGTHGIIKPRCTEAAFPRPVRSGDTVKLPDDFGYMWSTGLHRNTPSSGLTPLQTVGVERIPVIKGPSRTIKPCRMIRFAEWKSARECQNVVLHFYTSDQRMRHVLNNPMKWTYRLSTAAAVIAPDLSLFHDYPPSLRIMHTRVNRAVAAHWQSHGIEIIANVRWNDASDYEYCFLGCPSQSQVAVSSVTMMRNRVDRRNLIHGFHEMVYRLEPKSVIWHGAIPPVISTNFKDRVEILQYPSRTATVFARGEDNGRG